MLKTLTTAALAVGVLVLSGLPALAGSGCDGAVTAQSTATSEVAQVDQSSQQPAQTPRPATGTN